MRSTTGIAAAPDLPGLLGLTGSAGPQGPIGETGPEEPQGPAGSISDFADFYAIMPPDNDDPIEPGSPIAFPRTGSVNGSTIVRLDDSSFRLTTPGIYQVLFRVGIQQSAQLVLTLNGEQLPATVVGRDTGNTAVIGMVLIETTEEDSVLTVSNPTTAPSAITVAPSTGGALPTSAHLIIMKLT